jgi:hypothetical protein
LPDPWISALEKASAEEGEFGEWARKVVDHGRNRTALTCEEKANVAGLGIVFE